MNYDIPIGMADTWARHLVRSSPAGLGRPAGFGALSDAGVQAAAGALLSDLQSSGCTQGVDPTVLAFQQAYIAAGGSLPNDSDGSTGADGLYGANTQNALQAVLNAGPNQPPQAAPAGCVGVAPASGGGGGTTPAVVPATTASSSSGMSSTTWLLIGAGVLGAGIIGYAVYKKKRVRVVHLRKV